MLCKQKRKADNPPRHCPVAPASSSPIGHGEGRELECGLWCALEARKGDENGAKEARKAMLVGMGQAELPVAIGLKWATNPSPVAAIQRLKPI